MLLTNQQLSPVSTWKKDVDFFSSEERMACLAFLAEILSSQEIVLVLWNEPGFICFILDDEIGASDNLVTCMIEVLLVGTCILEICLLSLLLEAVLDMFRRLVSDGSIKTINEKIICL